MYWLLLADILERMDAAIAGGFSVDAEKQHEYEARAMSDGSAPGDRILSIAGGEAVISVSGVLTRAPDFMAWLFGSGNTTYTDIAGALATAENNPGVQRITMAIDSPGGLVSGLFDAMAAMEAVKKPITARVDNMAASAAYALASQADTIEAGNPWARFGSIGIVMQMRNNPDVVTVASTNAPKKAPDITTPEGRAVVREELDAMHALFADAVATGRGVTVAQVNKKFGQGAAFTAEKAKAVGMIDSIGAPVLTPVAKTKQAASRGGADMEVTTMTFAEFMAQHPDLYAQAVAVGVEQERDRVTAHLTIGAKSGAMDIATKAITEGSDMTATLTAEYLAAGIDSAGVAARATETAGADAGDTTPGESGTDGAGDSEAVIAGVEAAFAGGVR